MSKGYFIRGQGEGVMHDRVFVAPPSDEHIRQALARELAAHGVVYTKDDDGSITGATARERWVLVQPIEIVDGNPTVEDDFVPARIVGALDQAQLDELVAGAKAAPPGSVKAETPPMVVEGVGLVTNPT